MFSRIIKAPLLFYEDTYSENAAGADMRYVYHINKTSLLIDMIEKLTKKQKQSAL